MLNCEQVYELVSSDTAVEALSIKSKEELSSMLGRDFAAMKDFDQNNPHHCYDLLNHTVHTVLNVSPNGISHESFIELRTAALFHDIGKPRAARKKGDRTVFYNHSSFSAEIAEKLFDEIGITGEAAERILFFVKHHDDFINFKLTADSNPYIREINEKNVAAVIKKNAQEFTDMGFGIVCDAKLHILLTVLCIADAMSQSETAYYNGTIADTRENKVRRLEAVRDVLLKIC